MKEFGVAEEIIPEDFVHFGRMCEEMKEKLILDLKGWSKKQEKSFPKKDISASVSWDAGQNKNKPFQEVG